MPAHAVAVVLSLALIRATSGTRFTHCLAVLIALASPLVAAAQVFNEFPVPTAGAGLMSIAAGPDGSRCIRRPRSYSCRRTVALFEAGAALSACTI
jgi:hypothetical protein